MRIPKLCRHRQSGQAYVTDPATGKQISMGKWGTPVAEAAYRVWVSGFTQRAMETPGNPAPGLSVRNLAASVLRWAVDYYRKDGELTGEVNALRSVLDTVVRLFGDLPAAAFGPTQFKAVRQQWVDSGHARGTINEQARRLRRVFRWAVERELVPPAVLTALQAVQPLKAGRTPARETDAIRPAPLADVQRTLPELRPTLRALVQVQMYGSMRPSEARIMRPCDLDRSQDPWLYTPSRHKTQHRGRVRRVWLGPKAQEILTPLLKSADPERPLFRNRRGRVVQRGDYSRAVADACERAGVTPWAPRQLRKTQATAVRALLGPEAARVVLDHAKLETTEIYAERDSELARKAARELG